MEPKIPFSVEILHPGGVICQQNTCLVAFPATDGERAVLAHHAPFLCSVGLGILRLCKEDKTWDHFFVDGGTVEMDENRFCLLTQKIIPSQKIVRTEAEKMLRTAQEHAIGPEYSHEQRRKDIQSAQLMLKMVEKTK
jgi:F0F1-type ATP synthase epsilon subunit